MDYGAKATYPAVADKAAVKVNVEMLHLYWSIGEDIVKRNAEAVWGKSVINQLSQDLGNEFPDMKGFSPRNLAYMKQFYLFYSNGENLQQVAAKIGDTDVAESLQQLVAKNAEDNNVVYNGIFQK